MKHLDNLCYLIGGIDADNTKVYFDGDTEAPKESLKVPTIDLCKMAINSVPQGGINPEMMYNRLQVLTVLETQKNDEQFIFEDSQYKTLLECVNQLQFARIEAAFLDFINRVKKAG